MIAEMISVLSSFDPAVLAAFVAAGLLLNITPGADFLFVSVSGITGGPRVGMAAALGINIGVALHVALAAAGVSALLLANPGAYDAIRYAGAAYLVWLAIQAWRANGDLDETSAAPSAKAAIWRGFLTNVLNPKTTLFIFAFIPQFTDPAHGPIWMQIVILGAIFLINGFLFVLAVGATSGAFAHVLKSKVRILNKITSLVFGGLAARLIID
jgi:threonine/homoserine/homoserine lactone efflux protein